MKGTLHKRLKWIVALVAAFTVMAAMTCGLLLYWWSVSSRETANLRATEYFYDPPGGCIAVEALDRFYLTRYFEIPEVAENITILSDMPSIDICYIIASFSLPESELDDFLQGAIVRHLSLSHPRGGFWYGASIAGWPLVKGQQYLTGRGYGEFLDMVYEKGVVYIVISLSL